jgi:hypothetical protein
MGCVGLLLAFPGVLGVDPVSPVPLELSVEGGVVVVGGMVTPDFGLPPVPPWSLPRPWSLPPPAPVPAPAVVEASCPEAALTGAGAGVVELFGVAVLSSTLSSTEILTPLGQTLNETRPTRVTKTMAAPASRAPDAPTPTMKLSGVLFVDVLAAA